MTKNYILDTNVILHDCQSIFKFADNNVIVPITVIEELDTFKKESNELGRSARHFSNVIDELRSQGSLFDGVPIGEGKLFVLLCPTDKVLPEEFCLSVADNRILACAKYFILNHPEPSVLVSKDTNMRIKADALGIPAENYENDKIDFDSLYSGITDSYDDLHPNEFVRGVFPGGTEPTAKRFDADLEALVPLRENLEAWGLVPRNEEQRLAMDLLLNDDIKLVTLVGKAGTGKTLLSIAAGLHKVTEDFVYKKLLVSRPVFPMGKDIGFLPGDINDKLAPYMMPIFDNVEYLMSGDVRPKVKKLKPTKKLTKAEREALAVEEEKEVGIMGKGHLELVAAGIMDIEPLLYIRGRSIPDQFLIVDEAQNLTPHEVKTIVTRAGTGTKLVFTGDPYQIDNPYLDASSNGLTYLVEKMKGQAIAGHITLTQGERSELAEIASNIL